MPTTANRNSKMAVMVWIYGGGFEIGSSTEYQGHVLAAFNDVIVVTFNYRLGVLGFLNIPETDVKGNYGMLDQVNRAHFCNAQARSFLPRCLRCNVHLFLGLYSYRFWR